MARKLVEVEVPEGARLGFARDTEGGMRGLLFDEETNELVGHATLYDVDEGSSESVQGGISPPQQDEELDVVIEIIAQALALVAIYSVEKAAPHVRDWLKNKAVPAVKNKAVPAVKGVPGRVKAAPGKVKATLKRRNASKSLKGNPVVVEMAVSGDADAVAISDAPAPGLKVRGPVMSSSEAAQRLAQAVTAMAFAREQMRILHQANIVDDEGPVALASALKELSPQHLEEAIRTILEADPRMLERSTSVAITARRRTS